VILIATGSEVHLAIGAREQLELDGIGVRVVSAPCLEWFAEQSEEYQELVLPASVRARVSVEAGLSLGWHSLVGDKGKTVSIEHFGASADALVGDDGGAEYKCFYDPSKLAPMILDDNWDETTDQSAMGIWVTGRHWWDMCLYVPALRMGGLHFSRKRLERDDNWLELMEADLVEFDNYVCDIETRLRNIGANRKTLLEGRKQ
jgi:hypothetical protein